MKIGFWVGYIKNLVLKLRQTACERPVIIIQVVFTALVLVGAYCIQSFFFSSEPLNSLIGRVFDDPLSQNPLNGESIPRYLLLGPVFGALLLWAVITVWSLKLGFRLGILVIAALLGLILTPFLAPTIEYVLNLINCWMRLGETPTSDFCQARNFPNIQNNLPLLAMSLPVLLVLWIFRTYDIHQQIAKTQKQVEASVSARRTSTYDNILSTGLQLIVSDNVPARCIGLVQLALVRRGSPELKEQIDAATQNLILYIEGKNASKAEVIKLRGAMLENMNLREAIMNKADLGGANLQGVNLEGANLQGAYLGGANLQGANLSGANLEGVRLQGANLKGASLNSVNLQGVDLIGANLEKANISGSLSGARLYGANLKQADLRGVDLRVADLERAILIGAHLQETHLPDDYPDDYLEGANLEKANLKGANFKGANLEGARLSGANLTTSDLLEPSLVLPYSMGTNLDALLDGADLKGARYDESTLFPRGFDLEERGLRKKVDKDPDDFIDL